MNYGCRISRVRRKAKQISGTCTPLYTVAVVGIQSSARQQTVSSLEAVHQYLSVVLFDLRQPSLELLALRQHCYFSLIVLAARLHSSRDPLNPLEMG